MTCPMLAVVSIINCMYSEIDLNIICINERVLLKNKCND